MSSRSIIRPTIGRIDKIDFPQFSLLAVGCKIDTGAFTSSIHCQGAFETTTDQGSILTFWVLGHDQFFATKEYHKRRIKNSSGISEDRYVIQSKAILFEKEYDIQLTLADRGEMNYPVLLGRRFLAKNRFLVDVNRTDLSYKQSRRKTK